MRSGRANRLDIFGSKIGCWKTYDFPKYNLGEQRTQFVETTPTQTLFVSLAAPNPPHRESQTVSQQCVSILKPRRGLSRRVGPHQ
jgi:hypothetical protein